jgi:hypothetical protein
MIGLGRGAKVFASTKPTDMRKSFRTLAAVVTAELENDPLSGAVSCPRSFARRARSRLWVRSRSKKFCRKR